MVSLHLATESTCQQNSGKVVEGGVCVRSTTKDRFEGLGMSTHSDDSRCALITNLLRSIPGHGLSVFEFITLIARSGPTHHPRKRGVNHPPALPSPPGSVMLHGFR